MAGALLGSCTSQHSIEPIYLPTYALGLGETLCAGLDPVLRDTIRRGFLLGKADDLHGELGAIRERALRHPNDLMLEEAYLKLLALSADSPVAEDLRHELDDAVDRLVRRDDESPLAFAMCMSCEGLKVRFADNFIALNDSFERCRAIAEAALDLHGDNVDVLATVAKIELRTPIEYGGNANKARNLLSRAAALADDPIVAREFRKIAGEIEGRRELA